MCSLKTHGLGSKKGHSRAWNVSKVLSGVVLNHLWHHSFRSSTLKRGDIDCPMIDDCPIDCTWRDDCELCREWMQLPFRWLIPPCSSHIQVRCIKLHLVHAVFLTLFLLTPKTPAGLSIDCAQALPFLLSTAFWSIEGSTFYFQRGRFYFLLSVQLSLITLRKIPALPMVLVREVVDTMEKFQIAKLEIVWWWSEQDINVGKIWYNISL